MPHQTTPTHNQETNKHPQIPHQTPTKKRGRTFDPPPPHKAITHKRNPKGNPEGNPNTTTDTTPRGTTEEPQKEPQTMAPKNTRPQGGRTFDPHQRNTPKTRANTRHTDLAKSPPNTCSERPQQATAYRALGDSGNSQPQANSTQAQGVRNPDPLPAPVRHHDRRRTGKQPANTRPRHHGRGGGTNSAGAGGRRFDPHTRGGAGQRAHLAALLPIERIHSIQTLTMPQRRKGHPAGDTTTAARASPQTDTRRAVRRIEATTSPKRGGLHRTVFHPPTRLKPWPKKPTFGYPQRG